jgi:hypothetical protein
MSKRDDDENIIYKIPIELLQIITDKLSQNDSSALLSASKTLRAKKEELTLLSNFAYSQNKFFKLSSFERLKKIIKTIGNEIVFTNTKRIDVSDISTVYVFELIDHSNIDSKSFKTKSVGDYIVIVCLNMLIVSSVKKLNNYWNGKKNEENDKDVKENTFITMFNSQISFINSDYCFSDNKIISLVIPTEYQIRSGLRELTELEIKKIISNFVIATETEENYIIFHKTRIYKKIAECKISIEYYPPTSTRMVDNVFIAPINSNERLRWQNFISELCLTIYDQKSLSSIQIDKLNLLDNLVK